MGWRALTVCQPYAELIARGDKLIENRTWRTRYRGSLAIHAGQSRTWFDDEDEYLLPTMAFGAVVAVVDLVACLPFLYPADPYNWPKPWRILAENEHANGPWCWMLANARRLPRPIPCRGALGLWSLPPDIEAHICAS